MEKRMKFKLLLLISILIPSYLTQISVHAEENKEISIGATIGDFSDLVNESLKGQLERKGYKVKLVQFTDYDRPNIALEEGSLDVNIFQHLPYLEKFAKDKKLHLTAIAQVPTAPLSLYAGKKKSLKDAVNGIKVAVPNDSSNLSRALTILADLKWIKLSKKADPFKISPRNITKNIKHIKIIQLEAATLPQSLRDVDYAIINGNYIISSGLSLTSALAQEKSSAYINWAVIRTNDVGTTLAKDLIDSLNSDDFKKYAKIRFKGYKFPSHW